MKVIIIEASLGIKHDLMPVGKLDWPGFSGDLEGICVGQV